MIIYLEKLEKERADLIEVISALKNWQRFAIDDRNIISLQIAAHMMRLSALDDALNEARNNANDKRLEA